MKCVSAIGLVCLVLATAALPARADSERTAMYPGIPESGELAFAVKRGGDDFGRHVVRFTELDEHWLQVNVEIDLKVRAAFITFFDYKHRLESIWRDGELTTLESTTDDNGDELFVSLKKDGEALSLKSSKNTADDIPLGLMPTTYWNKRALEKTELLNTQNGEIFPVTITEKGTETITVMGEEIEATRYELVGTITVDLWYDENDRWVKCAFEARGQEVTYEMVEPGSI